MPEARDIRQDGTGTYVVLDDHTEIRLDDALDRRGLVVTSLEAAANYLLGVGERLDQEERQEWLPRGVATW